MIKAISFKADTKPVAALDTKNNNLKPENGDKKEITKNQKILLFSSLAVLAAGGIYFATRGKGSAKLAEDVDELNKGINNAAEKLKKNVSETVEEVKSTETPAVIKNEEKLTEEVSGVLDELNSKFPESDKEVFQSEKEIINNAEEVMETADSGYKAVLGEDRIKLNDEADVSEFTSFGEEIGDSLSDVDEIVEEVINKPSKSSFKEKTGAFFSGLKDKLTFKPKRNKSLTELTQEAKKPKKVKKSFGSNIKENWIKFNKNLRDAFDEN